jgi:hypothetical protein
VIINYVIIIRKNLKLKKKYLHIIYLAQDKLTSHSILTIMGADGHVLIFDADSIDANGLRDQFFSVFLNAHESSIILPDKLHTPKKFRVYTAYWDTRGGNFNLLADGVDDCEENGYLFSDYELSNMMVWT